MEAIAKELSNPAWWFTAVLAAIAINVISSYAKGWIDRQLARWFESRRNRSNAEREAWEWELKKMAASPSYWAWKAQHEIRCRLRGILYIAFGAMFAAITVGIIIRRPEFAIFARIGGFALCSFYLYFGYLEQRNAMRIARGLDASAIANLSKDMSAKLVR